MTNVQDIIKQYSNANPEYDFEKHEREFKKLKELQEEVPYTIEALFVNRKGQFGDQGVIYTKDFIVNLPDHLLQMIKDMRESDDVTKVINNRELAFEVYSYTSEQGRKGYSINLATSDAPIDSTEGRAFDTKE